MDELSDHLQAIDARTFEARLLRVVNSADRLEPVALEWVRRWGPQPMGTVLPYCGCASGRCTLCN